MRARRSADPGPADYVVVGAGSAGCALAARLSEDPATRVMLLEAGGRGRHPNVKIPAAFAKQFHTALDWDLALEPEPSVAGRALYSPRGKGLGGSSSMNAMLYVRGRPLDYDLWEAAGARGWGWGDVRPYFLRSEDNARGADENHAVGGPLRVEDPRSPRRLTRSFLRSAQAAGIPVVPDYNGPEQDGAALVQVTQRGGRRLSTADAYLKPASQRQNLEIVTHAHVLGLELDAGRATGVRFRRRRSGGERMVRAEREVILCAGAYGSPQLLMLSGIGPPEHLRDVGVEPLHELPGVGENLQDHPYQTLVWDVPGGGSLADAEKPKALAEWLLRGSGPLSSSVAEAFAFVRSRAGLPAPDIQIHFAPAYFVDHGEGEYDGHAVSLAPVLITPQSRGRVRLRGADPDDKPRVFGGCLTHPDDVAALLAGTRLVREIAASGPFADELGEEQLPGDELQGDHELTADIRRRVELLYHPVGTCRMGAADDDGAVVDPELRVRGLEGLRVADASVMPVIPGGNTNAPTIMVAERAADLIAGTVGADFAAPAAAG